MSYPTGEQAVTHRVAIVWQAPWPLGSLFKSVTSYFDRAVTAVILGDFNFFF